VQNFKELSLDLKGQIESAYKNRGGIIWLPKKVPTATMHLGYCGHISPFRNKADWFHVGRFTPDSAFPPHFPIGTSVMRECCANVLLTPVYLSSEEVNEGLSALKETKITRAEVREFIAPLLPGPHHRLAIQDVDGDLFEVVDVLTAMGQAEQTSYFYFGLFAGLLMTNAAACAREFKRFHLSFLKERLARHSTGQRSRGIREIFPGCFYFS
jgi:hypothetical protein